MSEDPACLGRMLLWYHGTRAELVPLIKRDGLTASYYGMDYRGFGVPLHTLARDRHQALLVEVDVVVILQVPVREAAEYLTCLGTPPCCQGLMSGLLQPLPLRMIHCVECL